jgi:hypothetical protein
MGDELLTLAGIAWDPHIRGVLTVLTAVVILMGSVYLILSTNVGSRLGFLLALGGFFGWMTILAATWWINPPAIGPRGDLPVWEPVEIVYGDVGSGSTGAQLEEARSLPNTCFSSESRDCELPQDTPEADRLIEENPELFADVAETGATLTELASLDTEGVTDELDFGGWDLVPSADAGEAQSEASTILVESGVFDLPTEFEVLDTFEQGGKDGLSEDPNRLDRLGTWIKNSATLQHPTRYAIVQVQEVVPVTPVPGEAPPLPEVDPDTPVISVVMVRDLGNKRVPPALVTIASGLMLVVVCYTLHRRDKLGELHRSGASASSNGGS